MNNALLNVIWDTMPAYGGAHEERERKAALPIARLSYQHATTGASDVNVGGRARPRASLQMESSEGNDGATTIASRGEEVVGEIQLTQHTEPRSLSAVADNTRMFRRCSADRHPAGCYLRPPSTVSTAFMIGTLKFFSS